MVLLLPPLLSCDFITGSSNECPPGAVVIPPIDDDPFYRYADEIVRLAPDSTMLTLSAAGDDAEVRLLLEGAGLAVESIWVLNRETRQANLHPETPLAEARAAVEQLRGNEAISFVAPVYHLAGQPDTPLRLLNYVVVSFLEETTPERIDCLNDSVGTSIAKVDLGYGEVTHHLAYPHGAEPLSIVDFYELHPLTNYSDPGAIVDVVLLPSQER